MLSCFCLYSLLIGQARGDITEQMVCVSRCIRHVRDLFHAAHFLFN